MNIQEYLKTNSSATVRVMNWENNRWLIFDERNKLWTVLESKDSHSLGGIIFASSNEEDAVTVLMGNE